MGPGRMHPRVLKELGNVIAEQLRIIFKRLWQLGEVPSDWKKANITDVLKKEDPGNCRPVSITSVPVKVVKQILLEALSQHTKDTKLIWSSQHGFAKGKSCLIDLLAFYDEMTGTVGKGV